jgi:hypothetical protein
MAGVFTTRRRKADAQRPGGQASQGGLMPALAALGIGIGRSSPHQGSKRGYEHLTQTAPLDRFERAQAWHRDTGRPLPPQMRAREPAPPPETMLARDRAANYLDWAPPLGSRRTMQAVLDDARLRPAQRRRLLHKAGQRGERPAGYRSAASAAEAQRVARARARRLEGARRGPAA